MMKSMIARPDDRDLSNKEKEHAHTHTHTQTYNVTSDGHDKPFCTKAITIINNFKKSWAKTIIDKFQFLQAIPVIDKLSLINFSDKCCRNFSMCLTKFFF